jgi:hypothetical protein
MINSGTYRNKIRTVQLRCFVPCTYLTHGPNMVLQLSRSIGQKQRHEEYELYKDKPFEKVA